MMNSLKLFEHGKFLFNIANFVIFGKFIYRRSKILCFLLYFVVVTIFLTTKFIQLQLLPISVSFVINSSLSNYDELINNKYGEVLRRLGQEFSFHYDRPKLWKVPELRQLINEAYSGYAAMYLSLNLYGLRLSLDGQDFYRSLRSLMVLLSNTLVRTRDVDVNKMAHIEVYEDIRTQVFGPKKTQRGHKMTKEVASEDQVSLLSLVHSENAKYVSDKQVMEVLSEFRDLKFFENVVSHCNNLYNIISILRREGIKEQSKNIFLQLFRPPRYTFGNLKFLKCLMIYQFKGVNKMLPVKGFPPGELDTMFFPDKDFLEEMEFMRSKYNVSLTEKSDTNEIITSLYGSDVYLKVVENYKNVKRLAILTNPNGGAYEMLAVLPTDLLLHLENRRSAIIFNYPGVGSSTGKPEITNVTNKCNIVLDYVLGYFRSVAYRKMELSFHGTSLGGHFLITMCSSLRSTRSVDFMIFHKSFGDLKKLSVHFVGNLVSPFLRFFSLDVNNSEKFLKIRSNKILVTDIKDEIIPLKCSLASTIARNQVLPGVGKLTNSLMDYKIKTLQVINKGISGTSKRSISSLGSRGSLGTLSNSGSLSSMSTMDNLPMLVGSLSDPIIQTRLAKDMLTVVGKQINSTGQTLLNMMQTDQDCTTKEDLDRMKEFLTRMMLYGSMPYNCIPRGKSSENTLTQLNSIVKRLDLKTNYFKVIKYEDEEVNNKNQNNNNNNNRDRNNKSEERYLIKIPVKVAVYLRVLLDEVVLEEGTWDRGRESDVGSSHSSNADNYYSKKRVVMKDGEFYADLNFTGNKKIENCHLLEHFKNDLRNFGLSRSRYHLTSVKLLSYFRLYSLVNVFKGLALLYELTDNIFKEVMSEEEEEKKDYSDEEKDIYDLFMLCKKFMFNMVEALIGEQFGFEEKYASKKYNEKEFDHHLNNLREEQRKYGVVIPQFVGHNPQNSPLDVSLLSSLTKNSTRW